MATFCLTKDRVLAFKKGLKDREIDPGKLATMTSEERRSFIATYVGNDNAKQVNALFESKLLLKNQKAGMIAWAKRVGGITAEAKRDLMSRIERLDRVLDPKENEQFLQDLASKRLGLEITQEEAKTVNDLSNKVKELRNKADKDGNFKSEDERLAYGYAKADIEEYVSDLKLKSKKTISKQDRLIDIAGVFKSIQSSLDNSFFGRQGIKVLYTDPGTWTKAFIKSWGDIGKELGGRDAIRAIKADIYSRKNSLNGKYDAGGYGLDIFSEEAYPSSLPSKIPLLGRVFKASESAYNGAALRMRADLADKFIALAEKNGLNMLKKEDARPIGHLIGSLTGRGSLGKADVLAREANILFYSVKFLKANIDTLIAPAKYVSQKVGLIDKPNTKGGEFASKEAAKASLRIIGTIALILATTKMLAPDRVDEDPTSTNFGKIKIFGHWVDITGGMGSLVRLASRIALKRAKNSSGNIIDYRETGFGARNALDELEDFVEGKFSPVASFLRDYLNNTFYGGEPFTWEKAMRKLVLPLPVQNYIEVISDPKSEFAFGSIVLDGLGFSVGKNVQQKTDWQTSTSADIVAFKKRVGDVAFKKANDDYNRVYNWWLDDVSKKDSYRRLSEDEKSQLKTRAKEKTKQMIFRANNFKYIKPKTTLQQKRQSEEIKRLLP